MEEKKIYLDNASTTPVCTEVLREMIPTFNSVFGNASSIHSYGRDAVALVDLARDRVAQAIGAKTNEIYFTSGGTEANNWAIRGLAYANRDKGNHIITSKIEHESVLATCKQLEKEGFKVTYLDVDENGLVRFADLLHYATKDTVLISIMATNNEIGTIQHIQAIARTAHEKGILFHTDAVQAVGHINFHVEDMGIDAMSISSHKLNGPKGAGALYIRNGVKIDSLIRGGYQERALRAGTLNVPSIVGFGKAIEIACRDIIPNARKLKALREYLIKGLNQNITDFKVNGHIVQKSPNIISLTFDYIDGEAVMMMLDMKGIAVSVGSACTSGTVEPSHVLKAIGLDDAEARGTIRISLSKYNTKAEMDITINAITDVVQKLRSMSPIRKKRKK